jgi:transcriptional regulator with XRE-family HTH domain
MARPSKLIPEIQKRIGDNIALGLTYSLAASAAGITYKTFSLWMTNGRNSTSGKYFEFYQYIKKCDADAAKALLERLNETAKAGDTRICLWILERRFSEDFGRRIYRKTNIVSENYNENVDIEVNDADKIREKILEKFALGRENQESSTI